LVLQLKHAADSTDCTAATLSLRGPPLPEMQVAPHNDLTSSVPTHRFLFKVLLKHLEHLSRHSLLNDIACDGVLQTSDHLQLILGASAKSQMVWVFKRMSRGKHKQCVNSTCRHLMALCVTFKSKSKSLKLEQDGIRLCCLDRSSRHLLIMQACAPAIITETYHSLHSPLCDEGLLRHHLDNVLY